MAWHQALLTSNHDCPGWSQLGLLDREFLCAIRAAQHYIAVHDYIATDMDIDHEFPCELAPLSIDSYSRRIVVCSDCTSVIGRVADATNSFAILALAVDSRSSRGACIFIGTNHAPVSSSMANAADA